LNDENLPVKKYDIAETHATMRRFKFLNVRGHHQRTHAVRRLIQQMPNIHDAGLAAKLPRLNLLCKRCSIGTRFLPLQLGTNHGMRRHVHLSPGVAVHQQHINVVNAGRANLLLMNQLKPGKRMSRPGSWIFRSHQQRTIHELRLRVFLR
jgi:hypothetical protein